MRFTSWISSAPAACCTSPALGKEGKHGSETAAHSRESGIQTNSSRKEAESWEFKQRAPKRRNKGRFLTRKTQCEFIDRGRDVPLLQPALLQLLHGKDQLGKTGKAPLGSAHTRGVHPKSRSDKPLPASGRNVPELPEFQRREQQNQRHRTSLGADSKTLLPLPAGGISSKISGSQRQDVAARARGIRLIPKLTGISQGSGSTRKSWDGGKGKPWIPGQVGQGILLIPKLTGIFQSSDSKRKSWDGDKGKTRLQGQVGWRILLIPS